jgi:S-adenosylmethionine uptake transporter
VIFIVQPGNSEVDWLGAGAALFGCLMFAALAIQTRRMSVSESTELMLLTGSALILLVSALAAPFLWIQPSANEFALMLLLGLIGLGGQYFLTNGFKYAPVYIVGALEYSTLGWAAFYGWVIFHDLPTATVIAGALLGIVPALVWLERRLMGRFQVRLGPNRRSSHTNAGTIPSKAPAITRALMLPMIK